MFLKAGCDLAEKVKSVLPTHTSLIEQWLHVPACPFFARIFNKNMVPKMGDFAGDISTAIIKCIVASQLFQ